MARRTIRRATRTRPLARVRRVLAVAALVATALAASIGGSQAATGNVTVTLDVLSATTMDASGCPASARSLGTILPDTSQVASGACSIVFGATNNSSMLKLYQQDGGGDAFWTRTDGTPDTGFGPGGIRTVSYAGGINQAMSAFQPDGKIVMFGHTQPSTDKDSTVVRLNADGTPDSGFGINGIAVTPSDTANDDLFLAGTILPDGKILAAGYTDVFFGLNLNVMVMRLLPNGTPDPSFGPSGNGYLSVSLGYSESVRDIDLLPDGSIMLTGTSAQWDDATTSRGYMTKVRQNGTLDTTFGTGGTVTIDTVVGGQDDLVGATRLIDGKFIVFGRRLVGGQLDLYASRRNADGSIDTTYGTSGIASMQLHATNDDEYGQPYVDPTTGVGLFPGHAGPAGDKHVYVTRLLGTGAPDPSWGTNGVVSYDYGTTRNDVAFGSWASSTSQMMIAGSTHTTSPDSDFTVTAVNAGGIDTSFSGDGKWQHDFEGGWDYANGIVAGRDGNLYATGNATLSGAAGIGVIRFGGGSSTIPDYGGAAVFGSANTQAAFGACLESRSGAGVTGGWTVDPGGACTAVAGDPWNAVADTSSSPTAKVLGSPTVGVTNATATFRFGIKTALATPPKQFLAPLALEVVAPNA